MILPIKIKNKNKKKEKKIKLIVSCDVFDEKNA
jgi:hypothetical protein